MRRGVVRGCGDALAEKACHAGGVDTAGVDGVCELGFVGEGDAVEPVENVQALAEAALGPLRGVVVRVDEAWDEEAGG